MGLVRVYRSNKMNFNLLNSSRPFTQQQRRNFAAESMKFAVKALSSGKARAGVVHLGSCPSPIETPCLLLSTRKGLPIFISPDLLSSLPSPDSHLLQFSPLHLWVYWNTHLFIFLRKKLLHNIFAFWLVRKICGYCTLLVVLTLVSWLLDVIKFSFDFFAVVD